MPSQQLSILLVALGFLLVLFTARMITARYMFSSEPYQRAPRRVLTPYLLVREILRPQNLVLFVAGTLLVVLGGASLFRPIQHPTYEQQLQSLDSLKTSLTQLQAYMDQQKSNLVDTEQYLQSLKEENQQLIPIVQANREVLNAILEQQHRQQMRDAWIGYGISFLLGVFSSMLADLLVKRYLSKRDARQGASPQNEEPLPDKADAADNE